MSQVTFIELDEKMQNTDMALDELLRMKLPKEANDAINMIIENLNSAITYISQIKEEYIQLEGTNGKLTQGMQAAKKQMNDLDIDMEG